MKDTPWFRHDQNAGDDEKMIAMRADYGWAGSGWYWRIVEYMRGEDGYTVHFSNKLLIGKIAGNLNINREKLLKFISDCCTEYFLFEKDEESFWSNSLHRRMNEFDLIRKKRSESGRNGAERRHSKGSEAINESPPSITFANRNRGKASETRGKGSKKLASYVPTDSGTERAGAREENSSNENSGASPPDPESRKIMAEIKEKMRMKPKKNSESNSLENLIPQALEGITP